MDSSNLRSWEKNLHIRYTEEINQGKFRQSQVSYEVHIYINELQYKNSYLLDTRQEGCLSDGVPHVLPTNPKPGPS